MLKDYQDSLGKQERNCCYFPHHRAVWGHMGQVSFLGKQSWGSARKRKSELKPPAQNKTNNFCVLEACQANKSFGCSSWQKGLGVSEQRKAEAPAVLLHLQVPASYECDSEHVRMCVPAGSSNNHSTVAAVALAPCLLEGVHQGHTQHTILGSTAGKARQGSPQSACGCVVNAWLSELWQPKQPLHHEESIV